jgi:hypothetical protein
MSGTKTNIDPIFAKIEAHRAAVAAWKAAGDISGKMHGDEPDYEAAERLTSKESDREMKALRALLRCRPTTLQGVIALLDHLGQPQMLCEKSDGTVLSGTENWWKENKGEVRALPHMLAGALRSLIGEPLRPAIDAAGSPR